ncbi:MULTISPECIES: AAA family ATPase [Enterobacterales]|uniref:ATP-binding cassette domain-containing protein n=1 Tax=Enterobacterales TaxID=91347 RepID=UPI000847D910|nr:MULTISPECIES: ATP-binding cassette domain-containing protein [Enterobacterales]ODQ04567.1 hypothetical protein BGK50_05790 [Shigella sp. FC130]OEI92102.1 hypothetical protein BHE86_07285 [Shigella sp. FC1655]WOO51548.1 ATP-binding cassette domain-containing protein [Hafnia alvei]WPF06021.1 ATP-binding cassette domain-containing protein [Proteus vulgaris]
MTFKLHNPSDIYKKINNELAIIIHSMTGLSSDENLNNAENIARSKLENFQGLLSNELASLQKNAEWNTFTIAFYGETGAGKSTLIETLRILLRESEKVENQKKYRQQQTSYQFCLNDIEKNQQYIEKIKQDLEAFSIEIHDLNHLYAQKKHDIQQLIEEVHAQHTHQLNEIKHQLEQKENTNSAILQQISNINVQIEEYKSNASLWQKILLLFKKLPEELILVDLESEIVLNSIERNLLRQKHDEQSLLIKEKQKPLYSKLTNLDDKLSQEKAQIKNKITSLENEKLALTLKQQQLKTLSEQQCALLIQYADGKIIGDGQADFTRETKRYHLKLKENVFSLLDVPGIEGKEGLVLKQIEDAVQQAHAVFYITNKAAPPQTGDEGRIGTLEKIKLHLNAQTEVWSIFNKKITNPKLSLKNRSLLSEDELSSLAGLDEIMREQLGHHYKKVVSLTALPAFLASTDCLVPGSQNAKRRNKFLQDFLEYELLERTGILDFIDLLEHELLPDSQNKIYRANLNKTKEALNNTIQGLEEIERDYQKVADEISITCEDSKKLLDSSFLVMKTQLNGNIANIIRELLQKVRRKTYSRIEDDISNDRFKEILNQYIEEELQVLLTSFSEAIKARIERFHNEAAEILQRYEDQAKDLIDITKRLHSNNVNKNITLDINIDNGINKVGLLSSLVGLALVPVTGGASLWIAGASALTMLVSVGKALFGYFSSSYKMSQQKKSTDENLRNIEKYINDELHKKLNSLLPDIETNINFIKNSLDEPIIKIRKTATLLQSSNQNLKNLAQNIQIEGNL